MNVQLDELRKARAELDAAIEAIRAVEGFENFLAEPTFADVAQAARAAPIVYIAAAEPGGVGLIVRGDSVEPINLEALTERAVRDRVDVHLAAYSERETQPERWNAALDRLCAWLWEAAIGPVLDALSKRDERADARAATLVAGGLLGLLPLHAAWTGDESQPTGRRYALDVRPLSYAPNARALTAARAVAALVEPRRVLAISEPWPVSATRLPAAALEADVCRATFPDRPVVLAAPAATGRRVARAATGADVLHLACHGFAYLEQPLESGLLLAHDERFTLRDLMALDLRVRLAVLSACETLLPGTPLPDEVVALPTGLLQAGVAGVVASMWAVPDRPTAVLMADFYRQWPSREASPAAALREAQQWLRDTTNGEKLAALKGWDWLPATTLRALMREVAFADPAVRGHDDINVWGAFVHVGA